MKQLSYGEVKPYLYSVVLGLFFVQILYNFDVVLVKRLFTSQETGYYTAISMLGKIIFFGSGAIFGVLFPKASAKEERGLDTTKILKNSLIYVLALGGFIVVVYNLIPNFVVKLLYGNQYEPASHLLGIFALGMLFFAMTNIFVQYYMAIEKMSFIPVLAVGAAIEIGGILLFHETLMQVVMVFTFSMSFLLLLMFLYEVLLSEKLHSRKIAS